MSVQFLAISELVLFYVHEKEKNWYQYTYSELVLFYVHEKETKELVLIYVPEKE